MGRYVAVAAQDLEGSPGPCVLLNGACSYIWLHRDGFLSQTQEPKLERKSAFYSNYKITELRDSWKHFVSSFHNAILQVNMCSSCHGQSYNDVNENRLPV